MKKVTENKVKLKVNFLKSLRKKGRGVKKSVHLPPGQNLVKNFPILDLGVKPKMDLGSWHLEVTGLVEKDLSFSLSDLKALGVESYSEDFHCVTTWSKFDVKWRGVPFKNILKKVNPSSKWKHLIQYGLDGYSTNVPKKDLLRDNVFLAFELDGKPIPREHGYIRLIIPHLYGWKTSKFLIRLEFSETDKPGFWETRGYHNRGNADLEERYSK